MTGPGPDQPQIHRITNAPRPHSADLDARMGRYLLSMLIRTVCVGLVVVVPGPLRWVFAAGAVVLPYVAVVMANTGQDRRSTTISTAVSASAGTPAFPLAPPPDDTGSTSARPLPETSHPSTDHPTG